MRIGKGMQTKVLHPRLFCVIPVFLSCMTNAFGAVPTASLVKDVDIPHPGFWTANRYPLCLYGDIILFAAGIDTEGVELWRSDGTEQGTSLVKDVRAGPDGSEPHYVTLFDCMVFFSADDGVTGRELWRSDGTEAGTQLVVDIRTGPESSNPGALTDVNDVLYFLADDGQCGRELWRFDGTQASLVKDVIPGTAAPTYSSFAAIGHQIVFGISYQERKEIWRSDGTEPGTFLLRQDAMGAPPFRKPVSTGNLAFFVSWDMTSWTELWRTDGTASGTVMVKDINPRNTSQVLGSSNPSHTVELNGQILLVADDGTHGTQVWKSDGTSEGTVMVTAFPTADEAFDSPAWLFSTGEVVLFDIYGLPYTQEKQVWATDGTTAGTRMIVQEQFGGYFGPDEEGFAYTGGRLYWGTSQLWCFDKESCGFEHIDADGGASLLWPRGLVQLGDKVLFIASSQAHGRTLWAVDAASNRAQVSAMVSGEDDLTPTWSWTSGEEGVGTFRYRLDNPDMTGATVTTQTSFTPGWPLSPGVHTLYVQEQDTFGNWSDATTSAIDVAASTLPLSSAATVAALLVIGSLYVHLLRKRGT